MRKTLLVVISATAAIAAVTPLAAQTCSDRIDPIAPLVRYTQHDDGTVTDRRTGLRWQRCPAGFTLDDGGTPLDYGDDNCDATGATTTDWQGALQAAESLNNGGGFAGFTDWRVPNIKELMSTVEHQCASPAVNLIVFPDTPVAARFWSSTTYIHIDTALALDVTEGQNSTGQKEGAGSDLYLRLVR